jgi:hypothetical protein
MHAILVRQVNDSCIRKNILALAFRVRKKYNIASNVQGVS